MATKYSDIIRIRGGKPAYSIEEEKGTEWQSFIANEQFNEVLRTVLNAVRGNDIDRHKSFWINGTYGTGKSHAAAVIKHLLCDPVYAIRPWVESEYAGAKYQLMKDAILSLRQKKRLLPVQLESLNNLTHVSELAPLVQAKVVEALNEHDIELSVDTDYDSMISHVRDNAVIWDDLIQRFSGLSSIVADRGMLIRKLQTKDAGTLKQARAAMREAKMMVMLDQSTLGAWLIEVQDRLRVLGDFTGLLILWDEFTDVMSDAVGIPVLKELQTIAQKFMNEENDSFLLLISHPSAFNNLGTEATKQTDGRYHRMKYNMESVSAFKIMSRKFEIIDQTAHSKRANIFYNLNSGLAERFIRNSNNQKETREDLYRLFPLHPGTANLATHYATVIGSSSRSVFEFIGQNDAIRYFLNDENAYNLYDTINADYLWDFVLGMFQDDVVNYGAVTERFNTYRNRVAQRGPAFLAVFKSLLLLNAFNNIAADESVTPSEENIYALFTGTRYEDEVKTALEWINEEGVIQRAPGGIFSVQFSSLPSHEIEEAKKSLREAEFRFTSQILKYGDTAGAIFDKKYVQKVIRPYVFEFFSDDTNDAVLRSRIKNRKRDARPSDLFIALLYARDNNELAHLRQMAEEFSKAGENDDKELRDIVFVVVDTIFGEKNYDRFIEYMANYKTAANHGYEDQVNVHRDHAIDMIKEWMQNALRGNAVIWINGNTVPISIKHLSSTLNNVVAPRIFPDGPDSVEILRMRAPSTFWKQQVSKEMIRKFIFAKSRTELLEVNGLMKPVQYLVQDVLDENLEWKSGMPEKHQFRAVYNFVNSTINNFINQGNTSILFDFTERFEPLTRPPYGLSENFASAAMVAFAMRPWCNKIYDQVGKPRTDDNLADDVAALFTYWQKGKATSKLNFKFQTPQEDKLCKELVRLFKLDRLEGYSDISSMKDARYALIGVYIKQKEYPVWSLKYMTDNFVNSMPALVLDNDVKKLIDNIVSICEEKDQKNDRLVIETINLIERYRTDFSNILNKPGSFRNGFENYMLNVPKVGLKPEEMPKAFDYIKRHLEDTVGYWTEEEVTNALKDWRMEDNRRIEEERQRLEEERRRLEEERRRQEEENDNDGAIPGEYRKKVGEAIRKIGDREKIEKSLRIIGDPEKLEKALSIIDEGEDNDRPVGKNEGFGNLNDKKYRAYEVIRKTDDPDRLRKIINRVIALGYEKILDTILNMEENA